MQIFVDVDERYFVLVDIIKEKLHCVLKENKVPLGRFLKQHSITTYSMNTLLNKERVKTKFLNKVLELVNVAQEDVDERIAQLNLERDWKQLVETVNNKDLKPSNVITIIEDSKIVTKLKSEGWLDLLDTLSKLGVTPDEVLTALSNKEFI